MSQVKVNETYLYNIGNAIRNKTGSSTTYKPSEMAQAISDIDTGYPEPTGSVTITENGTVDVKDKAFAIVNVSNSYDSGDEGKVVSGGALVAQTSRSVTENGTYDTTLNNETFVNVPGGVSPSGTLSISANGTYDVTNYASANVNVSGSGNATFSTGAPNSVSGYDDGDYFYQRVATSLVFDRRSTSWRNASSTYSTGQKIRCVTACSVVGFLVWSRRNTVYLHLSTTDGTDLASATMTDAESNAWNIVYLDTPVQLSAGTEYVVWYSNNGAGAYIETSSKTPADNRFEYIDSVYASGNNNFPSTSIPANLYPVDLLAIDEASNPAVVRQWVMQNGAWEEINPMTT